MIVFEENTLTAAQFCELQQAVGFGYPNETQIELALRGTLYSVTALRDGRAVGMGRLVGDGARILYLQDVFIRPECQHNGLGREIVSRLLAYIRALPLPEGSAVMVGLMAAKDRETFYEAFGFRARPNETHGAGMMMVLEPTKREV